MKTRRTLTVRSRAMSARVFTLRAPGQYLISHDDPIVVTQIADREAVILVRRHPRVLYRVRALWPMTVQPLAENAASISLAREVRQ